MDRWIHARMHEWMDRQTGRWIDDEQNNRWIEGGWIYEGWVER